MIKVGEYELQDPPKPFGKMTEAELKAYFKDQTKLINPKRKFNIAIYNKLRQAHDPHWWERMRKTASRNRASKSASKKRAEIERHHAVSKLSCDPNDAFRLWVENGKPSMELLRRILFDYYPEPLPSCETLKNWKATDGWDEKVMVMGDVVSRAIRDDLRRMEESGEVKPVALLDRLTEGMIYRCIEALRLPPGMGGLQVVSLSDMKDAATVARQLQTLKDQLEGNPTTRHEIAILAAIDTPEIAALLAKTPHWGNGAGPRPTEPPDDWDPDNDDDVIEHEPSARTR